MPVIVGSHVHVSYLLHVSCLSLSQVICEYCNNCRDLDLCRDSFIRQEDNSDRLEDSLYVHDYNTSGDSLSS